jgi:hypothetical protein
MAAATLRLQRSLHNGSALAPAMTASNLTILAVEDGPRRAAHRTTERSKHHKG